MQQFNPHKNEQPHTEAQLYTGQALLCRALNLQESQWAQRELIPHQLYSDDTGYTPAIRQQAQAKKFSLSRYRIVE